MWARSETTVTGGGYHTGAGDDADESERISSVVTSMPDDITPARKKESRDAGTTQP
jgi:hypothetical protein